MEERKKPLTIALVSDVLGDENNGGTIAAMNLIRTLKAKGHNVRIVSADQDKRGAPGYYILPTNWLNRGIFKNYLAENKVVLAKPDSKVLVAALTGVDEMHCMVPLAACQAAAKIANNLDIPCSYGFHTQPEYILSHLFMLHNRLASDLTYRFWWKSYISRFDIIHYPTQFIRDYFEKRIVGHSTEGRVISNGVQPIFYPEEGPKEARFANKFVILCIGRYSAEKGHKTLFEAALLSRHKAILQLIFAGQGPEEAKMREWGKKLPQEPILGFYDHTTLPHLINQADLYCHPSYAEIEAISCLEAMACGLVPVIADSPETATKYFASDERNLFRCGDSKDLARKIDYWIEHPEEKKKATAASLAIASTCSYRKCMDEMEDLLYEAIRLHQAQKKRQ